MRAKRFMAAAIIAAVVVAPAHAAQKKTAEPPHQGMTMLETSGANGPSPATSVPDQTGAQLALDGLVVAFSSDATNLVPGDTNGVADVFVRDMTTGTLVRASTDAHGRQANGASYSPALDVYGDKIAFVSTATNLVPGDDNGIAKVYLKDLRTGAVEDLSVGPGGAQANGASNAPFVSLYGNFVTFDSAATNLVAGDTNGMSDAFLRDVVHRRTERLIAPAADDGETTTSTRHARTDYTGRFVVFEADRYHDMASPYAQDVYYLDRRHPASPRLVDIPAWSVYSSQTGVRVAARTVATDPVISATGRYVAVRGLSIVTAWEPAGALALHVAAEWAQRVAWEAGIPLTVAPPLPGYVYNSDVSTRVPTTYSNVYVWDAYSHQSRPVASSQVAFAPPANGDSYAPSLSAGGNVIAYSSDATDLVPGDTNAVTDDFVAETGLHATSRVSVTTSNAESEAAAGAPSLSFNGRMVAFGTTAQLDQSDTNSFSDIYVRDRMSRTSDSAPKASLPFKELRVNPFDTVAFRVRATDPDHDPVRYGVVLGMPTDASIDPVSGQFTWHVSPTESAGDRYIWFWVDDPRGMSTIVYGHVYIRNATEIAGCKSAGTC